MVFRKSTVVVYIFNPNVQLAMALPCLSLLMLIDDVVVIVLDSNFGLGCLVDYVLFYIRCGGGHCTRQQKLNSQRSSSDSAN